jgi:hypothetical protein
VDVAGDWLAVLQGSVGTHILRREAGTWVPFQWLPADPCGADQGVLFARWSGDELLMGLNPAPAHGCGPELRVYRQTSIGAPFELRQTISLPLPPPGLGWGQAAAAEGRLLIGSPTAIYGQAVPKHGTVAVFDRGAANWEQSATLVPSWPVNNHTGMGLSLGLSGDDLFVGCPADNSLAASAGTIHLWRVGDDPCPSLVGVPEARSLGYVNGALGYLPAGRQEMLIDAGPAHAGEFYLVLGSLSGTAPGLSIDGQLLPLVFDAWTAHTLANPNVGPLLQTFGTLDAQGRALAALQLPAPLAPVLGGMTLHHAFLALSITPALQVTFASEPAGLFLWP